MKWICIKDFPESLFFVKEDRESYRKGSVLNKRKPSHVMEMLELFGTSKEYFLTIAEYRELRINEIFI